MRIWPEKTQDQEFNELGSRGFKGSLNARQYAYLIAAGYKGSLADMSTSYRAYSPKLLFASSEVGVWYDPSDLTTMFQDSAGTIPVTAVGQPVGLRLDKSGRGNHASQSTPGSRAIYASVPKGGRRNLYTNTGFSGGATGTPGTAPTGWTATFATGSITAITADASLGGNSITVSATAGRQCFHQTFNAGTSTTWTLSADVVLSQQTQLDQIAVFAGTLTGATMAFYLNGALVANTTQVPAGTHRVAVVLTVTTTALTGVQARVGIGTSSNSTGTVKVSNPQLEAGSTATAYQIVRTIYDIQEAGVQTLYGLLYDGLDDFYVTSAINFSTTDKMTVFAGVRKLSNAAQGIFAELTNSAPNRFTIFAPPSGLKGYAGASGGSTVVFTPGTTEPAPHSAVLTLRGDISGDLAELRVNSTTIKQVTTDQGAGNYANAALYIGRRGGTTLPFNGYEFGLIVRGAANLSEQRIKNTENWLNEKTRGY